MRRFEGRAALVTGAASGMGRATSVRLASEGASVFGVDVNEPGLAESANLVAEAGGKLVTARCDVSRRTDCHAAVERAARTLGRLDVLCNVAGIAPMHRVADVGEDDWARVLGINLSGVFFMSQAALPHLLESGGNIVNVASNAALMGQAYTVPYCASKAGVVALTRAMAMEFAKERIRINCICPAGTNTAITRTTRPPEDADFDLMKRYVGFRGLAEPEEIAAAIAFLASDEARNVHGSIFSVDGGVTAG